MTYREALEKLLEFHKRNAGTQRCRLCRRSWPCQSYRIITEALAGED